MINSNFVNDIVESKLLSLHTCYLAKVLTVNGSRATVQPLTMIKQYGKAAQKQAPVPDVPISSHCRGKVAEKELRYVSGVSGGSASYSTVKILTFTGLTAGNIVLCCCCDRDITDAVNGKTALPSNRRHSLSDSIIIGVL
jgi:hypothetical protein